MCLSRPCSKCGLWNSNPALYTSNEIGIYAAMVKRVRWKECYEKSDNTYLPIMDRGTMAIDRQRSFFYKAVIIFVVDKGSFEQPESD